jgi:phage tail-like protein
MDEQKKDLKLDRRAFLRSLGLTGSGAVLAYFGLRGNDPAAAAPPAPKLEAGRAGSLAPTASVPTGCVFRLEMSGISSMYFDYGEGIGMSNTVVNNLGVKTASAHYTPHTLILRRGISTSMTACTWRKMVEDGNLSNARKDGSLYILDEYSQTIAQYNIDDCWPSKIIYDTSFADQNFDLIEELVLAFEDICRVA